MQSSGIVVAVDNLGIGDLTYTQAAYYVQHHADGSWGEPVTILQAYGQAAAGNVQEALAIVGISSTNQALINNLVGDPEHSPTALLYNLNTQSTTDLGSLLQSAGYWEPKGLAIDADGRILLAAVKPGYGSGFGPTNLLLTPDGLSPDPIEVPVPEPGTLAVMLVAIGGFVTHRLRERRRGF